MSDHLLAVDVGNTHTTVGLFRGTQLVDSWRHATRVPRTGDELWFFVNQCLQVAEIRQDRVVRISISSVVPELSQNYARMVRRRFAIEPFFISAESVKSLRISYQPPSAVGSDRLCGAVAGADKYGTPLIVVDLGTATVFDVIDEGGTYLGGAIAPGVSTAASSLHAAAALLPTVELSFPPSVIGTSTESAIRSGVLFGGIDLIDGMVSRIRDALKAPAAVVGTGGFAALLQPQSRTIQHVEPDLVLHGIRIVTDQQ
ncbi:type III pantothenate kinase [candidate division KSB1 bacterium]|nr:type III pantothenate kinase [candidate division KSB1 bacterium]